MEPNETIYGIYGHYGRPVKACDDSKNDIESKEIFEGINDRGNFQISYGDIKALWEAIMSTRLGMDMIFWKIEVWQVS